MSNKIGAIASINSHFYRPYAMCEVTHRNIDPDHRPFLCVGKGSQTANLVALEMMPEWEQYIPYAPANRGKDLPAWCLLPPFDVLDMSDPELVLETVIHLSSKTVLIRGCGHSLWMTFVNILERHCGPISDLDGLRLIHYTASVILPNDKTHAHSQGILAHELVDILNDKDWGEPPIKKGVVIHAHAYIGPFTKIGHFALINTGAIIEHNCNIGENCSIQPGAKLMGHVTVGDCTEIGAGAIIAPHVTIGKNCLVHMGSVVTRDVPDNSVVKHNHCEVVSK
jgi:hypothetical protein